MKVTLTKTTKIDGKLSLAGSEVEVTASQKKELELKGIVGIETKQSIPTNDKEIQSLISENEKLKSQKTTKAE